ncbi:folate-binding protein YgfZ [Phenylobacterium sp. LjRoot225]|uniref:CAF17-like 4Fe-4S cluster assembly/insertion protein YgfZ n=1 Tax=Phenylobacterium sp. LjRoot225 TaxID=3342285 RepID=UPI003ECC95D7
MTSKPAFAELPSRALIAVGGADWRSFLQGLLTQDVESLAPGEARLAALLTPQGRLLWDMFVVGREDSCWLDVAREHREAIVQRLSLYRLRAKVEIAADAATVSALFGPDASSAPGFIRDPRLPELGWRGYGASAPAGAELADDAAYDDWRLELGVPGPADWGSDKTYPIEANFDLLAGIDFKKGCFVGQETTSRMKRRGQIKTRMLPIVFDGEAPAPGVEVLAGTLRAGEVCSGTDGRAMALLRLDRIAGELTVDGWPVSVERPDWMVEALGQGAPA